MNDIVRHNLSVHMKQTLKFNLISILVLCLAVSGCLRDKQPSQGFDDNLLHILVTIEHERGEGMVALISETDAERLGLPSEIKLEGDRNVQEAYEVIDNFPVVNHSAPEACFDDPVSLQLATGEITEVQEAGTCTRIVIADLRLDK